MWGNKRSGKQKSDAGSKSKTRVRWLRAAVRVVCMHPHRKSQRWCKPQAMDCDPGLSNSVSRHGASDTTTGMHHVAVTRRTLLKPFGLQPLHITLPPLCLIDVTQPQAVSLNLGCASLKGKNTHDGMCAVSEATHSQRMPTSPDGTTGLIATHHGCVSGLRVGGPVSGSSPRRWLNAPGGPDTPGDTNGETSTNKR